jgi:hypothetical protein
MPEYDCFIEKVNEAGFYTPFVNYIDSELNSDIERGWRIRATQEKKLACGYFFTGKPGYIAPHYFSIFIDAFRPCIAMEERYADGKLGKYEKAIWDLLCQNNKPLGWHEIRNNLGFKSLEENKVEAGKAESALKNLQMTLDVCICGGIDLTHSQTGDVYTTVLGYGTVDDWVPTEWMEINPRMEREKALAIIYHQAEKISTPGNAKKAFTKSLKLIKM